MALDFALDGDERNGGGQLQALGEIESRLNLGKAQHLGRGDLVIQASEVPGADVVLPIFQKAEAGEHPGALTLGHIRVKLGVFGDEAPQLIAHLVHGGAVLVVNRPELGGLGLGELHGLGHGGAAVGLHGGAGDLDGIFGRNNTERQGRGERQTGCNEHDGARKGVVFHRMVLGI